MNTNFNTFKIQDALDALGVKDINLGTSTRPAFVEIIIKEQIGIHTNFTILGHQV